MSTFRVLQFNVQYGQRWDEVRPDDAPIDLNGTIAEIQRHDADVVLLQEIERAQPNGLQRLPPPNYERLKAAFDRHDSFFAYPPADPRELPFGVGLAIFSRTPLRAPMRLVLPSPPIEFLFEGRKTTPTSRLLIGAKTTVCGREVQLFNTHLLAFFMLGAGDSDYLEQRLMVAEQLAASKGPTVLGGDFNVSDHRALVAQFAEHHFSAVQVTAVTWRRRPYVLDHIFYNAPLRMVSHAVVPTPTSDHHVVIADFEFGG